MARRRKRKHGAGTGKEIIAASRAHAAPQASPEQSDVEGALARLDRDIGAAEKSARQAASALRIVREKAARELSKIAAKAIADLGFKKADFRICLRDCDPLPALRRLHL